MASSYSKGVFTVNGIGPTNSFGYAAPDHTTYTNGTVSGQRLAVFLPTGAPRDYPDMNGADATKWACYIHYQLTGYTTSSATLSDTSANVIQTAQGFMFQVLNRGAAVAVVQMTSAAAGQGVTGNGFWHPPGGVNAYYESTARPNAHKDAVMAIQFLRMNADAFGINPEAIAVGGISAGAGMAAWIGLAPNRAWELGSGGQHNVSTVPNCCVFDQLPVAWWNHYDALTIPVHFPIAETGGAGADDTATTNIGTALTRAKIADSAVHYISELGRDVICTPPCYYHTASASGTSSDRKFGQPFIEAAGGTNPHTAWHAYVLRNNTARAKLYVPVEGTLTTGGLTIPANFYDGIVQDIQNEDNVTFQGTAVNFLVNNIRTPRWDAEMPTNGIWRRGYTNFTGRYILPPNSDRQYAEVYAGTQIGTGGAATLAVGPTHTDMHFALTANAPFRRIYGSGPLWAKAGNSGEMCFFHVREVPHGVS